MRIGRKRASELAPGDLIVDLDALHAPIEKVLWVRYPTPEPDVVRVVTVNQLTGQELPYKMHQALMPDDELVVATGNTISIGTGELTVELAQYRDDEDASVFRYRIKDAAIDFSEVDLKLSPVYRPQNKLAMAKLITWLTWPINATQHGTEAYDEPPGIYPRLVFEFVCDHESELLEAAANLDQTFVNLDAMGL